MIARADRFSAPRRASRAALALALALGASLAGCELITVEPDAGCVVDGKHYDVGAHFTASDGCNGCTCGEDGLVACTAMACVKTCSYGGEVYTPGERFPAADGCNTCSCGEDGAVGCTLMACAACSYGGKVYTPGETFPATDGCNTCKCAADGSVACTKMACASCSYAGKTYKPGDVFPALDGCNSCQCGATGAVSCTEKACTTCSPKDEWWRHYVGTSPQQCALIDFMCPASTGYFANACGCGCEQAASCPQWFNCMPPASCDPAKIKEQCPYSGIAY